LTPAIRSQRSSAKKEAVRSRLRPSRRPTCPGHYITNILEKLHVRSRVEAAMLAVGAARADKSGE